MQRSDPQAGPGAESRTPLAQFDSRKLLNVKFSINSWSKEHGYLRKKENRVVFLTFSMIRYMVNCLTWVSLT